MATSKKWKKFFKSSVIVFPQMNLGQAFLLEPPAAHAETTSDQPLDRALAVLYAVAEASRPISMTEIASNCGLPVPTVHRLVSQLERRGMLGRALGSKRIVVGQSLVKLGMASLEAALRADQPHQILVTLANRLGEHCHIGRRFDDTIVYVNSAKAPRSDGLYFEQGGHAPIYCTSIGKLFLAEMTDSELEWWLGHADLQRMTPSTMTTHSAVRTVVRKARREDWTTTNQELVLGVVGCAVPIRSTNGRLIAGLGLSAPSARIPFEHLHKFKPVMQSAASEIAALISDDD